MAGPIYIDAEVIPVRDQGLPWPLRRSEDTSAFARTYPVVPAQEVFNEHFGRLAQVENWRMFGLQRRSRSSVQSALRNRAAVMHDAKGS